VKWVAAKPASQFIVLSLYEQYGCLHHCNNKNKKNENDRPKPKQAESEHRAGQTTEGPKTKQINILLRQNTHGVWQGHGRPVGSDSGTQYAPVSAPPTGAGALSATTRVLRHRWGSAPPEAAATGRHKRYDICAGRGDTSAHPQP
jgi:hypothetical protein